MIALILLLTPIFIHADGRLTADEITLEGQLGPGATREVFGPESRFAVSRRPQWELRLVAGRRHLSVNESEYTILSTLWSRRGEWMSVEALHHAAIAQSQVDGPFRPFAAAEVAALEKRIVAALGKSLIFIDGERFRIAAGATSLPGRAETTLEILDSGRGILYRGRMIELTPRQMQLIGLLAGAKDRRLTFTEIRHAMSLSRTSRAIYPYVGDINHATFMAVGAHLIDRENQAFLLDPRPRVAFAPGPVTIAVDDHALALGPRQARLYERLRVNAEGFSRLNEAAFAELGMSLSEFRRAADGLNRKMDNATGRPFVRLIHLDVELRTKLWLAWDGLSFVQSWNEVAARRICAEALDR